MSYTVTGFFVFMFSMILWQWPCIIKTISLGGEYTLQNMVMKCGVVHAGWAWVVSSLDE